MVKRENVTRKLLAGAFALLMVMVVLATGPAQASESSDTSARSGTQSSEKYYISLGDSLAAGTQPDASGENIPFTDDAYTNVLYSLTKWRFDNLKHIKLGCPGETTASMIDGVKSGGICSYDQGTVQLPPTGTESQLTAALDFIQTHPGQIAFITIDLGANDLLGCLSESDLDKCVMEQSSAVAGNLDKILRRLRGAAPDVPIVGMNYYNPKLGAWLLGPGGQIVAQQTTALFVQFNTSVLAPVYGKFQVPIADVTGTYLTTNFTPIAGTPINVLTVCHLTWACDAQRKFNIHPNRLGYAVIASTFYFKMLSQHLLPD